jgi:hypothetical protein
MIKRTYVVNSGLSFDLYCNIVLNMEIQQVSL